MKLKYTIVLLLLLTATTISAQLVITAGTQFAITGNQQVTFQNTDLINNGNFTAGNSLLTFTGNAASNIGGTQPLQFNAIEIKKSSNVPLLLQRNISISQRILFSSGFMDLNTFNADLGTTAQLQGESANSRVIGSLGGELLCTTNLNVPVAANPANLGLLISSAANLGQVQIRRGHQVQPNVNGSGASISRYYDIVPTNNNNLNATLRLNYFDAELNGLNESSLSLFQKQGNNWLSLGSNLKDSVLNFSEKNSINSFSRFTLANTGVVLSVHFISFNVNCDRNKIISSWETSQEINSDHFTLEKSEDGNNWFAVATIAAAGTSANPNSYAIADADPSTGSYYRVVELDKDGHSTYSKVVRSSCAVQDVFSFLPNPFHDLAVINIAVSSSSTAVLKIYDDKAALVKTQLQTLLAGNNNIKVDMRALPNAAYHFVIEWNHSKSRRTVTAIKQ